MGVIPYNDGLLEAKESNQPGWVQINWVYPGKAKFKTMRIFLRVVKAIKDEGYKGWLAYSEWQYQAMHKGLLKMGCYPYAGDAQYIYFKKEV